MAIYILVYYNVVKLMHIGMMWLFFKVKFKFTQTKHRKKIGIKGLKIFFNKILLIKIFTSLYTIVKQYFIKGISIYLKITKSKFRLYLL
jgi:hypothetical protein